MAIEAERIGAMRYATDGASAVNLYSTGTASGLTDLILATFERISATTPSAWSSAAQQATAAAATSESNIFFMRKIIPQTSFSG